MFWPMFFVALAATGLAVLAVLAVRVGWEVRRLSRQVGDSAERIARAAEDLERAAGPLAARAGTVLRQDEAAAGPPGDHGTAGTGR